MKILHWTYYEIISDNICWEIFFNLVQFYEFYHNIFVLVLIVWYEKKDEHKNRYLPS